MDREIGPHLLLVELHGRLLRRLSDEAGAHFGGLQVAGRFFAKRGRIGRGSAKKLAQLDSVTAWLRHVTRAACEGFIEDVEKQLRERGEHED